jgi:ABC-type iron transport system FetAB ATPase subunit
MTTTLDPEEYRLKLQYHRQQPQLVSRLRHTLLSSRGTNNAI